MAAAEEDKQKRDWLRERVVRGLRSFGRIWSTPERLPTTLAIVIGTVTGLGAWGFSKLVNFVETLYFTEAGGALKAYSRCDRPAAWPLPMLFGN